MRKGSELKNWKRSVFIPIPKRGNAKECLNYRTIVLISHASKIRLKILQARRQQYVNWELPDAQAGFRKGRGTRDQTASICWITEKATEFQKNTHFCLTDYAKGSDYVDHNQLWNSLKEMGISDHLTCLPKTCMQVKKQQVEPDTELRTGLKLGKEYKAVHCHPSYLTYMLNTSGKMPGWMNYNLESRLPGEININNLR